MSEVKVILKDGSVKQYPAGISLLEVAKSLNQKLGKHALLAVVNGKNEDLTEKLEQDAKVEFIVPDSKEGLHAIRHTASHVMAQAIQHLFPDVKFAIGPAIENGFYYDLDSEHVFTPEDLRAIEKEMAKIVKQNIPLVRSELSRAAALEKFEAEGEKYKVELINDLPKDAIISIYSQGDFTDLCAGPHCPSTGRVKAFKLMSIAGAYWRGSEKNKMLQRIYGTAFASKEELEAYLHMLEEAEKRDHRKLGKELEIFTMQDEGPGFPFFLPNGIIIKNELINYWREVHRRYGYVEISTPMILNRALWERSGHWDHYKENMYFTKIDDEDYAIKPMNCPGGMLVYKTQPHSYKELPIRAGELGLVHRHELSGALHGLFRVRCFTQDDAHIFCRPDQLQDEIYNIISLNQHILKTFGFDQYDVYLSTRPEKYVGSDENWKLATEALKQALDRMQLAYSIDPGEGVFYGPKIDIKIKDQLNRSWQCSTIQVDFNLPERFAMTYTGDDGADHQPIMIHRALMGSLERFIGVLIEHYAGAFPVWLAPEQARIMNITDDQAAYCEEVYSRLRGLGVRIEKDLRNEKLNYKIREAQLMKVPYMLIIGEREKEDGTVTVRKRDGENLPAMTPEDFARLVREESSTRLHKA